MQGDTSEIVQNCGSFIPRFFGTPRLSRAQSKGDEGHQGWAKTRDSQGLEINRKMGCLNQQKKNAFHGKLRKEKKWWGLKKQEIQSCIFPMVLINPAVQPNSNKVKK